VFFYYKEGYRKEGRNLTVVLVLFFIGVFNDAMVLNGVYKFLYLIEYTFIFILLFMTLQISSPVLYAVRLEADLANSEERNLHIVEGMTDGVGTIDANGTITYVNDSMCKMAGISCEALIGHQVAEFLDEENKAIFAKEKELFVSGKEGSFDITWTAAGGMKIHTIVSPVMVFDKKGEFVSSTAVVTDITDRKLAEDALKQLYENTRQVSEMKSNLITFASHELKTPLVPIIGWTDVVHHAIETGQDLNALLGKEEIESVRRSANRLSRIISNFLDVGRLERGSLEVQVEPFSIGMLVENAIKELDHVAKLNDIIIHNYVEDIVLNVDGLRLEEVFINILSNAIKFSPHGMQVELYSVRSDQEYSIYIQDQGIGFLTEELENVWQPFSKVYLRKKDTNPSGTGVGLYLSKGIVELHGGKIEITSPGPDLGSTVKITLPLKPNAN
jgi:PAS domain S-box-containing protein